jgi:hypothetical protein
LLRVPAPTKLQETPRLLLSLATVADKVVESAPSTETVAAEIETLVGPPELEPATVALPPHPVRARATIKGIPMRVRSLRITVHPRRGLPNPAEGNLPPRFPSTLIISRSRRSQIPRKKRVIARKCYVSYARVVCLSGGSNHRRDSKGNYFRRPSRNCLRATALLWTVSWAA